MEFVFSFLFLSDQEAQIGANKNLEQGNPYEKPTAQEKIHTKHVKYFHQLEFIFLLLSF